MKILFLDHYGVMCMARAGFTRNWDDQPSKEELYGRRICEPFDTKAVKVLNSILQRTSAEIVVSSDWTRGTTLSLMGDFYLEQGIIKRPRDFTTWLPGHATYHQQRAAEIHAWLDNHPKVDCWAAVDDLNLGVEAGGNTRSWGLVNFVWTENIQMGITEPKVIESLLALLGS